MGIIADQYKGAVTYLGIAVDGQPGIGAETQRTRQSRGVVDIEPKHQAGSRGDADLRSPG